MIGGPGWCLTPEETRIYLELKARRPDGWEQEPWFAEDLARAILAEQTKADAAVEQLKESALDRLRANRYYSRYREETEAERKVREEKQRLHNAHIKQLDHRRIGLHKLMRDEFDAAGGRTNWLIAQREAGRTYTAIGNQIGLTGYRVREIIKKEERIRAWRAKNPKPPPKQATPEIPADLLAYPVDQLELGVRAANCLKNWNIITIGDLIGHTRRMLLRMPNFGNKSLREIESVLTSLGLWLEPEPRSDNPRPRPPPPEWLR